MKSKPVTYLLLAATILIWGIIVWKIIRKPAEEEPPVVTQPPPPPPARKDPRDSLWLEYRDPFLGTVQRGEQVEVPEEPTVQFDMRRPVYNVRYHGRIVKNRVENCIIDINGEQFVLRKGMAEDGFRLRAVFADSVRMEKEGHTFTVPLTQ